MVAGRAPQTADHVPLRLRHGRFTQDAEIPGNATNCGKYVTGIACGTRDAKQPWRAPGTAPVFSPCGASPPDRPPLGTAGCPL